MSHRAPCATGVNVSVFAIFAILLVGCPPTHQPPHGPPPKTEVYVPQRVPFPAPGPLIRNAAGIDVQQQWSDLKPEDVRPMLPNWYSTGATYASGAGGGLSYLGAGITGGVGEYE